ncbi:aminodeoxychorismate/anthranilate synthase component II [Anaerocolumna sedimenticola]|uniref:Aminodeoxychorismate/anthranilate synthase component II n=1 Tax=Anaerocolumna sedimenticola TaxID=2696063 RepID=A0A6P1TN26_9FIRM|nr:aminodeoxychorismate/anthranilate synthase component II [Anaerocolumna sedimenticola]QHQ61873.1 aminodeoxychorismate/anthranilate synthase component II [Anaerocolumna sedimenticola]
MILLIDNYDSFSYNLVQLIGSIIEEKKGTDVKTEIKVIRNDELMVKEIKALKPSHIILSPGPGRPMDAGVCEEVVKEMKETTPILGVCLGHQAICEVFGATITYASTLMHGKQSIVKVETDSSIFKGLPEKITVGRYHSLAAKPDTLPEELKVTGIADDGDIMAVKHKKYEVYGLQFHPESVLTPNGKKMMENFLK